ncbi:head scaffolding protein [Mycobacterium phage Phlei]|uniref:Scaffold protein n=1 Tax=Mycobacterium phage Phlei TaxID=1690684 RepID=A0A0N7E4G7_9CAUD|nr:head scaffolding protein [Mycobacterium phage Phlei]ALA48124.1 hypothetical protein [Mycobacterium phage Phlei]
MSDNPTPDTTPADESPAQEANDKPLKQEPKTYSAEYVTELRQEAAAARVAKREAEERITKELNEKHQAELADRDTRITELENEIGKAWIELEKVYLSLEAKVPNDKVRAFVEILEGTDKESIAESVKSRLELVGGFEEKKGFVSGFDPTQGFGGKQHMALNGDPIVQAVIKAVGAK